MLIKFYLYTRNGGQEDVLQVGEIGDLISIKGDIGTAEALAELAKLQGKAAIAKELSASNFKHAKDLAEQEQRKIDAFNRKAHSSRKPGMVTPRIYKGVRRSVLNDPAFHKVAPSLLTNKISWDNAVLSIVEVFFVEGLFVRKAASGEKG
jgi:hypothetical protein